MEGLRIHSWLDDTYDGSCDSVHTVLSAPKSDLDAPHNLSGALADLDQTMAFLNDSVADEVTSMSSRTGTTSLSGRPILSPTGPKKLMTQLSTATPPVLFIRDAAMEPESVSDLRRRLWIEFWKGIIPPRLRDEIREVRPTAWNETPEECFAGDQDLADLVSNWRFIRRVFVQAARCSSFRQDESAWVALVREVLNVAQGYAEDDMLEVTSVQTQQIDPTFLPTRSNAGILVKKADIALGFSLHNSVTGERIRKYHVRYPDASLSHMADVYTSMFPMVCGIEVKDSGGDYIEAVTQLGIWSAACLAKMAQLQQQSVERGSQQKTSIPPIIGWTVIGHEWKLHICWKDETGTVTVLGPINSLTAGTGTYTELFALFALLKRVRLWLSTDFWDWMSGVLAT